MAKYLMNIEKRTEEKLNQVDPKDKNYGEFSLVFFSAKENKSFNDLFLEKLSSITTFTKSFNDIQLCEEWILGRRFKDEKVIFILGDLPRNTEQLIEHLHNEPQLLFIYLFDQKKDKWTENYLKVHVILKDSTNSDEENNEVLLSKVTSDQKRREVIQKMTGSSSIIPLNNFENNEEQTSSELTFIYYNNEILIDVMTNMPYTDLDRQEFSHFLKQINSTNKHRLKIIQEFEQNDPQCSALRWYTKEPCFYETLNSALRTSDFDTIIKFRPFISDLSKHLKELYLSSEPSSLYTHVYRSQWISNGELDELQTMVNTTIWIYSFFSTTSNQDVAMRFLSNTLMDDLRAVLFEIDIQISDETLRENCKPFADISAFSQFPDEQEILFMLGSIFRVTDVSEKKRDDNTLYTLVKLQLIYDKNFELKDGMRQRMEKEMFIQQIKEYNQYSLATVLKSMGEYTLAKQFYQRQLNQIESNQRSTEINILCALCYGGLGDIALHDEDLDLYNHYNLMALKRSARFPYNDLDEFDDHFDHLSHEEQLKNDAKLIELLNLLQIKQELYNGDDHLEIAQIYFDLMEIYYTQKKWKDALTSHKRALDIMKKYLPHNHPDYSLLSLYESTITWDLTMQAPGTEELEQCLRINDHPNGLEKYRIVFDDVLVKEQNYTIKELLGDGLKYLIKNKDTHSETVDYIHIPIDDIFKDKTAVGILFSSSSMFSNDRHHNRHLIKLYRDMFADERNRRFPFEIILISYDGSQQEFNTTFSIMPWAAVEYGNDTKQIRKRNLGGYFGTSDTFRVQPSLVILKTSNGEVLSKNGIEAIHSRSLTAIQLWCEGKRVERLSTLEEENQFRWTYIGCDQCETAPLIGLRYKCQSCEDYDLCQACHQSAEHQHHKFDLIKKPIEYY